MDTFEWRVGNVPTQDGIHKLSIVRSTKCALLIIEYVYK